VTDSAQRAGSTSAARRIETPRRLKWHHHLFAFLTYVGVKSLGATWRLRLHDPHNVLGGELAPCIAALWHNRLALAMPVWTRYFRPRLKGAGLVALISASHDGGVLARGLKFFGVQAVRGSSSRRGAQALLELTTWIDRGYMVAITPDGPRGPRYEIRDGILALAQVSGLPIVPVATQVRRKITLKSWDRFQVPLPFAVCEIRIGQPLHVPPELSEEGRQTLKRELKARRDALTTD
jgi:lysophospholipid acyltransferase (LPLAT)-like uncharacterized protein